MICIHRQAPAIDSTASQIETRRALVAAGEVLRNSAAMQVTFHEFAFDDTLVAVWNVIRSRPDAAVKVEMIRRLAEEISEGVGMCAGGRIGRLVNSLRAFVDVGIHFVHERESLTDEFARKVVAPNTLTPAQRREIAERVLDEHGVNGETRAAWLDSLAEYEAP